MSTATKLEPEAPRAFSRHYSPAEIAGLWSLSVDAVRRLFEREADVLVLSHSEGKYRRRRYRTLRIPEFVVERVHRRLSIVAT